jgi:hypothetical protein
LQNREIVEFEKHLDMALGKRGILRMAGEEAIQSCADALSIAYSDVHRRPVAAALELGMNVALPFLVVSDEGQQFDLRQAIDDLMFMSNYFTLREYLYYTHNWPDSFDWTFADNRVEIRFKDRSIPRQFFQFGNSVYLSSLALGDEAAGHQHAIVEMLRGNNETGSDPQIQQAFDICIAEAIAKMDRDFGAIRPAFNDVKLPEYTFAEFLAVYQYLLAKALYHRYWALANDTYPATIFPIEQLHEEISIGAELSETAVVAVLTDLTYARENAALPPMNYLLWRHEQATAYVIVPQRLISQDGLVSLLRVQSNRSPEWFSSHISGPLGAGLVDLIAARFRAEGYVVRTNVSLSGISAGLPDIDVMVFCREPTLGYVVFACEVKASIPALWAKDHLRVLRSDSLPKAFIQTAAIRDAVSSERGSEWLMTQVGEADTDPLPEGLVVFRTLIITSHNTGMFFTAEAVKNRIVDYLTLSHILAASDGDTAYVVSALSDLAELFDSPELIETQISVDGVSVSYEQVPFARVVEFPKQAWRRDGTNVRVTEEFFAAGGSPFDALNSTSRGGRALCGPEPPEPSSL